MDLRVSISTPNGITYISQLQTMSCEVCGDMQGESTCGRCTLLIIIPPNPDGKNESGVVLGSIIGPTLESNSPYAHTNFTFEYNGSQFPTVLSFSPTYVVSEHRDIIEVRFKSA
jgi:hypothetical protein